MWQGPLDSVFMNIATSRGKEIRFKIDRPGTGEMDITTKFEIPETQWWQRKKTRVVGLEPMSPEGPISVGYVSEDPNAPARLAGLEKDDEILAFNGVDIVATQQAVDLVKASEGKPIEIKVKRDGAEKTINVTPVIPEGAADGESPGYMIGLGFSAPTPYKEEWVKPGPIEQIKETVRTMWITIRSVTAKDSDIGIQHLSGPVGIGKIQYYSLLMDHPFNRIMAFMVLININLAILNMLPFPVLDGGHITIATMEAIARRPVNFKILEILQLGFVFILFGIMIYVTSKDVVDDFGMGSGDGGGKLVFPAPASE
jgi:regulator of sigma E protease